MNRPELWIMLAAAAHQVCCIPSHFHEEKVKFRVPVTAPRALHFQKGAAKRLSHSYSAIPPLEEANNSAEREPSRAKTMQQALVQRRLSIVIVQIAKPDPAASERTN